MSTELPSTVVATPTGATVVTPIIKKPILGRICDGFLIGAAFLAALLSSLGDINFASLGLTQTQAAWASVAIFVLRFSLAWRPVRLVDMKSEPADRMDLR